MDIFEAFTKRTVLHKKTTKIESADFDESNRTFEKTEETYQEGDEGPQTNETRTAYTAGCRHVLHNPTDHLANCSFCNKALCQRCGNLRCSRCLSIICSDCSRLLHGVVFCRKCRAIVLMQAVFVGCLRGIHSLFSREIG